VGLAVLFAAVGALIGFVGFIAATVNQHVLIMRDREIRRTEGMRSTQGPPGPQLPATHVPV